jgi:hypothetical protein
MSDVQDGFNKIVEALMDGLLNIEGAEEPSEGSDGVMCVVVDGRHYEVQISGGLCGWCGSYDPCECYEQHHPTTTKGEEQG